MCLLKSVLKNYMRKILLFFVLLFSATITVAVLWSFLETESLRKVIVSTVSKQITQNTTEANLLQSVLGFDRAHTYLFLFLNNTELRPAGGFIGSYAVINVDQGKPRLIKVEGTEILDNTAPKFESTPPDALQTYLGIEKWSFRDSNWNPDFTYSAEKSLELYKKEKGTSANDIEGVIGFTPTVIEEFLRIVGPIQVNGEEFNADNFTEKLEYEVEYGFAKRGITFSERKRMLADLTSALLAKVKTDILKNGTAYWKLGERLLKEKQIVVYSPNVDWQKVIVNRDRAGEMKQTTDDYLLWTDANLGALKTDVAIKRALSLQINLKNDSYEARATMQYKHVGRADWRISRYRTYSRIYVPLGSKIIKVEGKFKNAKGVEGAYDQGEENGRQWFGAFTTVEPGKTVTLTFVYTLSPEVTSQAVLGKYNLLLQKQIGTIAPPLTLELDFGKKLKTATPGEATEKWGDNKYNLVTDLNHDRMFNLEFER
jgi:hypothetical protein